MLGGRRLIRSLGSGSGVARQLQVGLLQVIQVQVAVAAASR